MNVEREAQRVETARHAGWVRISHWIAAASILTLAVSGVLILMVHPRLYWGEAGNDLTPALIELNISRNHRHGGWTGATPFFSGTATPISASRTFVIFNQNGWARSLHVLSAWIFVVPGLVYLINGVATGHFRAVLWPRRPELAPRHVMGDVAAHLRWRFPAAATGPHYRVLQKLSYCFVIFVAAPLMTLTGLAMAPAVTAAFPVLLRIFGGYQSARTIHFFTFVALAAFTLAHVVMIVRSGFIRQMRGMTIGE